MLCIKLGFWTKHMNFLTERWLTSHDQSFFSFVFCFFFWTPGDAVYPQCDLGTNKKRHVCKLRPSVAIQLASTVWHCIQGSQIEWICGINKPAGGHINMKDGFSNQTGTLCSTLPKVTATALTLASQVSLLHHNRSPSVHLSPSTSRSPVFSPHPFSSLPFSFPHSSLAWVPRQMVHASRCSPPSLSKGKTKAGSKANKICWRVPEREQGSSWYN